MTSFVFIVLAILFISWLLLTLLFGRVIWSNLKAYVITKWRRFLYPSPRELPTEEFDNVQFLQIKGGALLDYELLAQNLKKYHVAHIYLIHGTFVGSDPFDMIKFLESLKLSSLGDFAIKMQKFGLKQTERFFDDVGNFTDEYRQTLFTNLNKEFSISNFYWSSANHHFARFEAAYELLMDIHKLVTQEKIYGQRVLFVGHSHAGQLFALLTQFLVKKPIYEQLHPMIKYSSQKKIDAALKSLEQIDIDFVTLGTPVRYEFCPVKNIRLLHITNHRGQSQAAGEWSGLLNSRDGDYIQQIGIEGSDSLLQLDDLRKKNKILNEFLGTGHDLKELAKNLKLKKRVHPQGLNLLVDFDDHSTLPNLIKTLAGHGIYTELKAMPHLFEIINKYLYDKP